MLRALDDAVAEVEADAGVRVVVIAGNGPAFSAGHDLGELRGADTETATEVFDTCSQVMLRIGSLSKPVIAKVAASQRLRAANSSPAVIWPWHPPGPGSRRPA